MTDDDEARTICDYCSKDMALDEVETCPRCENEMCDDCLIADHDCEGE
jgi:hypothetical protein